MNFLQIAGIIFGVGSGMLLGYESGAAFFGEGATISNIVRRWRGHSKLRRALIIAACTIVAWSVQFLAFHFGWDSIG